MRTEALRYAVSNWKLNLCSVLDLACGDGSMTGVLSEFCETIEGADACRWACRRYMDRHDRPCSTIRFADIAIRKFPKKTYSLIVCSYGLQLCDTDLIVPLLEELAKMSPALLVIGHEDDPWLPEVWWRLTESHLTKFGTKARLYRRQEWVL